MVCDECRKLCINCGETPVIDDFLCKSCHGEFWADYEVEFGDISIVDDNRAVATIHLKRIAHDFKWNPAANWWRELCVNEPVYKEDDGD
jgi:hypothetical protein